MIKRRQFLGGAALLGTLGQLWSNRAEAREKLDAKRNSAGDIKEPYRPVVVPGVATLPYVTRNGVKEFRLVAEPVTREFAPGMKVNAWGYNGSTPGPTIEAVEGDTVRIIVTNKLPEKTSVHWHGLLLPNGMDGVGGLTQPHIPPGETWAYEFTLKQHGTFMYHPHSDEMVQMAMGMMGLFIVHPKNARLNPVDRDYAFLLMSWDIEPGTSVPNPATMTDFNTWSMNSLVFPAIPPLVARKGERVRMRFANLSMTNHPIHLHGTVFETVATDGGWIRESARIPEVTTDVPVGAIRVIEFNADLEGDWALHCHKSHHTMGPMGHKVPNLIGVNQDKPMERLQSLLPDKMVMAMGSSGMGDMQEMSGMGMELPENTLPMMTGDGPFGPVEMGGMMTVLKVRKDQKADDYTDPGWYTHPEGTQPRPWKD